MKKIFAIIIAVALCASLCIMVSAEKDPDTRFCAEDYWTGWWIWPASNMLDPIDVTFTTPNAFDGFTMSCFASNTANGFEQANVKITLSDADEKTLEETDIEINGDHNIAEAGFVEVSFKKAYAKGTYTITFELLSGDWFVLGSASASDGDYDVDVAGSANTDTREAPSIWLTGAEAPADGGEQGGEEQQGGQQGGEEQQGGQQGGEEQQGGQQGGEEQQGGNTNPNTADASVIAIAAVAAVALAGVVIAKKIK